MMIMNFVWPITARYGGPIAFWGYFKSAPKMTTQHMRQMKRKSKPSCNAKMQKKSRQSGPTREQVAVADTHCGAGCTLGDIVGEWWIFGAGLMIAGGELGTRLLLDF